ncbi:MAG TPA: glycosyltransferase family 2 protein [Blastocatellia bacterium]|nr:glycosyltransferase family 2 protein [Blastocatellia bacterium]
MLSTTAATLDIIAVMGFKGFRGLGGFRGKAGQTDLSIVVPVYRSQDCLEALIAAIEESMVPTGRSYEVILVNDCSPDNSWQVIASLCDAHPNVVGVDLRRNFGQDNAIITGLRIAAGKYVAIMDDDLQHHPRDLPALVEAIERDLDVVYADFRTKHQSLWKNAGSWFNGKVAEWVIDKPPEIYLSPYKIIRKEVASLICNYDGPDPYIDGLIFQVTSRIGHIPAEHHSRHAGRSTYTFWKSVRVWARLAFSFSVKPLRLVTFFGISIAVLGVIMAGIVAFYRFYVPRDFPPSAVGWASLMVVVLVVGGIQLVFLGIIGEYAGRTFLKVGQKPQSTVRLVLNGGPKETGARAEPAELHEAGFGN